MEEKTQLNPQEMEEALKIEKAIKNARKKKHDLEIRVNSDSIKVLNLKRELCDN